MHKDQEQELARLGLELLAEEGEDVIYPTTGKKAKSKNTDRTDVKASAWTRELEKAERRRFPWWLFVLLLAGVLVFFYLKGRGLFG